VTRCQCPDCRRHDRRHGGGGNRRAVVAAAGAMAVFAAAGASAATHGHHHHHGQHGSLDSVPAPPAQAHGQWGAFLAAIRAQESGGNYGENAVGCLGAYCWNAQSNWDSMAQAAGLGQYAGTNPASLPPGVQDAVASTNLRAVFRRTGSLTAAAEWWNGGKPYSIPNPALPPQSWAPNCGGGTSGAYACQVLDRMNSGG
jgi:hypothetical protein